MSNQIHSTAIVSSSAELGQNNVIGPYAVIEDDVQLGNGNVLESHVVIKRFARLENENHLSENAVIGAAPQHTGFTDLNVRTDCQLGSGNVIREGVTIHRSFIEGQSTVIGDGNYLMVNAHVGHDCTIGNQVTIVTGAGLGGHVSVSDRAFISGGVMVHQFVRIGRFAMIGGNSKITQDVLPFMITDGHPAIVRGLNLVGLKRAGFGHSDIKPLKQAFSLLFDSGALQSRIAAIHEIGQPLTSELAEFVDCSERGFHRTG